MADKATKRTNDLYCRAMPSAKAIEEIKHLAAIKRVTVAKVVHGEHNVARTLRASLLTMPGWSHNDIAALLKRWGVD